MRLQKQLSKKIGNKEYVKWVITIPPENIEKLGWKEGQNLKSIIKPDGLFIAESNEIPYYKFKSLVQELIKENKFGLTWQEIRDKLKLPQTVPNNKWVIQLERDIGLKRRKEGANTYWYLPENGVTVYTIGYEGKSPAEFLWILQNSKIQQLIDVRELALSRKNGFAKSALSKIMREHNIIYKHFPALGSPREIRHKLWQEGDYKEFFKEYSGALSRAESQEYLTDLEGLAHVRRTAIMCFEKDVEKCHRKIIKERLIKDGFKVVDI